MESFSDEYNRAISPHRLDYVWRSRKLCTPAHVLDSGRPSKREQVRVAKSGCSVLGLDRRKPGHRVLKAGVAAVRELLLETDSASSGSARVGRLIVAAAGVPGKADLRFTSGRFSQ
eukprot:981626-Prorocentrum_minimum.AAC.1